MRIFKDYGLALVLVALFLSSWGVQAWTGWQEFKAEQAEPEQPAAVFGSEGYIWNFAQATTENWQSEFLQLLTFVVFTRYLLFKGSPESRDSDDEMKASLERIESRLADLETPAVLPNVRQAASKSEAAS